MEIREFFILAFEEPQPLGPQAEGDLQHFSFMGYLRAPRSSAPRHTLAEHVDMLPLPRLELPGNKLRKMGRFMVTTLGDPTGELRAAKDSLFGDLLADGYTCSRSGFYRGVYRPHVSHRGVKPGASQHARKLKSFALTNLSVAESRFDSDYNLLGSHILHTRVL